MVLPLCADGGSQTGWKIIYSVTKHYSTFWIETLQAGESKIRYSDTYKSFIQDMNKGDQGNGSNPQLEKARDAQTAACENLRSKVLNQALKAYRKSVVGRPVSDIYGADFEAWASSLYAPCMVANDKCMAAENDFRKISDLNNGNSLALFNQAIRGIQNIMDSTYHEGYNMPLDQPKNKGGRANTFAPLYSMYGLEGVVDGWKHPTSDGEPAFSYDSSKQTFRNSSKTTWGGGHVGFVWEGSNLDASGRGSSTDTVTQAATQKFAISFAGLALMDINIGLWLDGWRSANVIQHASAGDKITKEATNAFNHFFGTAEKPGPAAIYNTQAVVAYKPVLEIQFTEEKTAAHFQTVSAEAEFCFLFICGGGGGGSTTNNTNWEVSASKIKVADTTGNAYIVGFVKQNYWASSDDKMTGRVAM